MRPITVNRKGNTVHIIWEDGREQVTEIVGLWDYLHEYLHKFRRHSAMKQSNSLG